MTDFYVRVGEIHERLWEAHLARKDAAHAGKVYNPVALEGQPPNGSCIYMARVARPGKRDKAGSVSICALPLAAKRIANGTHAVATFAQIAGYVEHLAANLARLGSGGITTSQPSQG